MDSAERVITVLVADDHPIIATGLRPHQKTHSFRVVADITDPSFFTQAYEQHKPDVVVLDVNFGPGRTGGLEICRSLIASHPDARVVFYSQFDQNELIREAYRLGCLCFLTKAYPSKDLADAIRRAFLQGRFFPPGVSDQIAHAEFDAQKSPRELLDDRSLKVFLMSCSEIPQDEIAAKLGISVRTVVNIMSANRQKLGVSKLSEMIALANRYHLIDPFFQRH